MIAAPVDARPRRLAGGTVTLPGRHLSVSQIKLLQGCPRQWRYAYLDGVKQPSSVDLAVGIAFHAAAEAWQRVTMAGERATECETAARDTLETSWAAESARPGLDWRRETPESALALCRWLFAAWQRELAPLVVPVAVEQAFSVPVPGLTGWTLDGRIDVVADDGYLVDLKTSGHVYLETEVDADLQATAYLWAWRAQHGETPPGVAFHVALKSGGTQELVTRRTAAQLEWFEVLLRELVRQIEAEALPANAGYRWCGYCPAVWAQRCMPWR